MEGARFTREQVAPRPGERWLLVTSAFHLPRAVASFCAAQWPIVPYPADYKTLDLTPYFSLVENLSLLDLAVHEWLGLLYYRMTNATEILYPDTTAPCIFPAA
ncbi:MAG: YdcF family protein [Gammaproteobacteria bacterium]|nr:YdcF family protein [Gammaproteobacteria bacterium]